MASLDQFSEFERLEQLLLDAVRREPIGYDKEILDIGLDLLEQHPGHQKEEVH